MNPAVHAVTEGGRQAGSVWMMSGDIKAVNTIYRRWSRTGVAFRSKDLVANPPA